MKIAIPDLISNSYFPAVAAVELGCFKAEGLDVALEMIFPVDKCARALHDGAIDFFAGSSHSVLAGFPDWQGGKLICAQAQGMYWFLVMRKDLAGARGDLSVVKGRNIGAAPWVEMGLRGLLLEAGIDPARDGVRIAPVPGAIEGVPNFGMMAMQALEAGKLDGFWANGMGTETAVRRGIGTIVADVRRGDGPKPAFDFTMAAVAASDALIARSPDVVAAAGRAIVRAQKLLKEDPARATPIGEKLFPPEQAALIAELIRRDLPYYDAAISPATIAGTNRFARTIGILSKDVPYEQVVATQFSALWR